MMFKTVVVLALLACYGQAHNDIDELIKDIFSTTAPVGPAAPPSTGEPFMEAETPCDEKIAKCVHYYLCDYQYQSENKEVSELLSSTASSSYCPSYLDTCCLFDAILEQPPK